MSDLSKNLAAAVRAARESGDALCIRGQGSKQFYGRPVHGTPLELAPHTGIVDYQPGELVFTARSGTPLQEVEAALAEHGQCLPFEPPRFAGAGTLGGAIAGGLSGPARPWRGSARDHVLGLRCLDGRGRDLRFGGQVMKNVAGYDVSRLMCGALGTLGVLLEISLKVLPRHAGCSTQVLELTPADALARLAGWNTRPLPISAACHLDGQLFVRIAGAASAVDKAAADIGGEPLDDDTAFWDSLRDQGHAFFGSGRDLWRISVAPAAPLLDLPGDSLIDWGGALRWLASDADAVTIRAASNGIGGHATLFRARDGNPENQRFEPLPPALAGLHARLKAEFDPAGILNPGRMYPEQ